MKFKTASTGDRVKHGCSTYMIRQLPLTCLDFLANHKKKYQDLHYNTENVGY